MSEPASLPAFSRRRLLLSGIAAIPAAAVIVGTAPRPGTAPPARTPDRRPAWPLAADSAAQDRNGAYFC
jgi:hypothetical protein